MTEQHPKLQAILPELAEDVRAWLVEAGKKDLSLEIGNLPVYGRCGCDDETCTSIETAELPKPHTAQRFDSTIELLCEERVAARIGLIDGKIVRIDTHHREDVKKVLPKLSDRHPL